MTNWVNHFVVQVGLHQGSVLSPLLFVIVLEALSKEFCTGSPWELLYADALVIGDSLADLQRKFDAWKSGMEDKGLRVNVGKTKLMVSGPNLNPIHDSGKHPCGVCRQGVSRNSIFCKGCKHWVHWRCTGKQGRAREDPSFRCNRWLGVARAIHAQSNIPALHSFIPQFESSSHNMIPNLHHAVHHPKNNSYIYYFSIIYVNKFVSNKTEYTLLGSRWSLLTPSAIWVTC